MILNPLRVVVLALSLGWLALGCASPISVKRVSPEEVQRKLTESVLSNGRLSEGSRNAFRRSNLLSVFETDPELALAAAHSLIVKAGIPGSGDLAEMTARGLAAVSEACFLYASQSGDRRYFIMSAIYAWAFLFGEDSEIDPLDPVVRLTTDLYNRALTLTLMPEDAEEGIVLRPGTLELPIGRLEVRLDPAEMRWGGRLFTRFTPVADLEIRGLKNRYREPGIGAPLAGATVAPLGRTEGAELANEHVQVPVSVVLVIEDVMAGLGSGHIRGYFDLATMGDPYVEIQGRRVPVELEPSASLALTLSRTAPWRDEIRSFFGGDVRSEEDRLSSLLLHEPGRIQVVLVHGTASSIATWADLLNDLLADPEIRRHYEFRFFTYNTGAPILYSAYLLRQAISDMVATIDPKGEDPALRRTIVIGHSQGGLLARLMAVDSGDVFWNEIADVPLAEVDASDETRKLIESAMFFEPSPYVGRLVFIATPHRGSYLLTFGPTKLLRGLVQAPTSVVRATADLVAQNPEAAALRQIDDIDGALGQMNPSSPFLESLNGLPMSPKVRIHSIIAMKEFAPKDEATDGVVAYESAHLDAVESEVVVESGHSCLSHPFVIEEVRRILLMNLGNARRARAD